jgi:hypothetical protein
MTTKFVFGKPRIYMNVPGEYFVGKIVRVDDDMTADGHTLAADSRWRVQSFDDRGFTLVSLDGKTTARVPGGSIHLDPRDAAENNRVARPEVM